jgi:acetoin utilization deacetylase AcuC-like enzyme
MPLREWDTSTVQAAADAFLSSPRYAKPNTCRGYAGVLDRLLAALGASRSLAEAGLLEQLWGQCAPATWNRNRGAWPPGWLRAPPTGCPGPVLPASAERRREHINGFLGLRGSPAHRVGRFCYDTMTLVGPGSWAAIRGAADAALTAADLVRSGHRLAYALCRPPGHHATAGAYGGSCYLNNAAIAAQALRAAGARRVAVIDIDAHHGNGTQMIFYGRADVWYGSLHVDPGAGWFPHYAGYAGERGSGAGEGFNRNLPLAPGTGDDDWLAALDLLGGEVAALGVDAVVVSLGLDAAAADPESPLRVTEAGYFAAGRRVAALGPAVLVQEGGYDLPSLGGLAVAAVQGACGR